MSALAWDDVVRELMAWREQDWVRPLDVAFARFIGTLAADAPGGHAGQGDAALLHAGSTSASGAADATVTLLAALLSHLEGRGHTCLALDELAERPAALLAWPADALQAWTALSGAPSATRLAAWQAALRASPVVDALGSAEGHQPLVLHGHRLYLRRYWRQEQAVAAQVSARVANTMPVDEPAASQILAELFGPANGAAAAGGPDWQRVACAIALRAGLSIITGGPGTGKTYTVARLLALLLRLAPAGQPLHITLAAPTGKAAARLRQSIEQALATLGPDLAEHIGPARTLHALLGVQAGTRRLRHSAAHPLEVDVLIVDEASMVHLEMMAALLDALPAGTRLVLLGDKDQLASVEAGAVLGDLCRGAEQGGYDEGTAAYVERLTGQRLPAAFMRGAEQDAAPLPAGSSTPTTAPAAPARKKASPARSSLAQGDLFDTSMDDPAQESAPQSTGPQPPFTAAPLALARQTVMLRQSRRFGGPIGQLALAVNAGDTAQALAILKAARPGDDGVVPLLHRMPADPADVVALAVPTSPAPPGGPGAADGYRGYLRQLATRPPGDDLDALHRWAAGVLDAFDQFRVLCAVREGPWGVKGLNQAIEEALVRTGLLRKGSEWYEGRPVMIMRNDAALGVYNGDVGVVLRWPASTPGRPSSLRVFFKDGHQLRSVPAGRLADVETAFAMTVHKSQGSEFGHAVLALSDDARGTITRELVYTGITRARQAFSLVAARADVFMAAIGRRTRRHSGLADALVELSSEP